MVDALLYVLSTGGQWRSVPHDFPLRTTVQRYLYPSAIRASWLGWMSISSPMSRSPRDDRPCRCPASSTDRACHNPGWRSFRAGSCHADQGPQAAYRDRYGGHVLMGQVHRADIQDSHSAVGCCMPWPMPARCATSWRTGSVAAPSCSGHRRIAGRWKRWLGLAQAHRLDKWMAAGFRSQREAAG